MKSLRLALGGIIAITVGLIGAVVTTTPADASAVGGQISRSEVLDRARHWYNQDPPRYDGSDTSQWLADVDGGHRYRRDCSGFVSMSLHLASSPSSFQLSTSTYGVPISWQDLRPGDYLTVDDGVVGDFEDGHVILFEGWAPAYPKFTYYGFGGTDGQRNGLRHRRGDFSGAATSALGGAWPQSDDGGNGAGNTDGHPTAKYKAYKYKNIVEDSGSGIATLYNPNNHNIEVYYNSGGVLTESYWNPTSGWVGSHTVGGPITGTPSALINPNNGNVEIYYNSGGVLTEHFWSPVNGWQGPVSLGNITGSPTAIHNPNNGNIEIYYNSGGTLTEHFWSPVNGWQGPVSLGSITGSPTAVHNTNNHNIEVYYNSGGVLTESYWNPTSGWVGSHTVGGPITGTPSALINPNNGNVEVYYNSGGTLTEHFWSPLNGWQGPLPLGNITGSPTAVHNTNNHNIEVYYNSGGVLTESYWNPTSGWVGSHTVGGPITGTPSALINPNNGNVEIYYNSGGTLTEHFWSPVNGWQGPVSLGAVTS
ncbi:hypothetical protein [Sphaerisporangium aureirubrum]|uniref:NlpC/P60 domain-containing protein n=1 Tax=Sphaerisporangium aureirubrum TaxID=1544736 RepID=A0ABW1NDV2_9ACTN